MGNVPSVQEFFHTGNDSANYWGSVGRIFTNVADTMLKTAAVILTPVTAAIQASEGNFAGAVSTFTSLPGKMITQFEAVGDLITDPTKEKNLTLKSELGVIGGIAGVPVFATNLIYDTIADLANGSKAAQHVTTATARTDTSNRQLASNIMSISDPSYKQMKASMQNTNVGKNMLKLVNASVNYSAFKS